MMVMLLRLKHQKTKLPSRDWLEFVKTSKTRNHIKKNLRFNFLLYSLIEVFRVLFVLTGDVKWCYWIQMVILGEKQILCLLLASSI